MPLSRLSDARAPRLRRSTSIAVATWIACAAGLGGQAEAQGSSAASVSWVRLPGAEACIDAHALANAVERRLGRAAVMTPVYAERTIEGRIEPLGAPGGFRASFAIADASGAILGTREIASASASCRSMDEDLALVIALMIDPGAATSPISAPAWTPLPAPVIAAPPAKALPPKPPHQPFRVAVRGAAAVSFGQLPSVGVGAVLRWTFAPPRAFPFEVGASLWTPQRVESRGKTFGADVWLAQGELSACPLTGRIQEFSLWACAGVSAGVAHVGGFGLARSLARDVAQVSLTIGAQVRRSITGPLFWSVGIGAAVPFVRLGLYYDSPGGPREVSLAPPILGTADVGLGVDLW